ncbi:PTS sugar transporter subunit IIA [Treponema sp.]|uniref:PTS sugar transporter subunit IIA n=1 Tax=Treponema sp. TaxID=166 RepID=UPI003F02116F
MVFAKVFSPKSIIVNLESEDKDELFEEMVQVIHSENPEIGREEALSVLHAREAQMSTGIMHSVAVPHGVCASVKGCVGAIGISRKGIDYDALDGAPVNLVFMLLCGPDNNNLLLEILKGLAIVLQDPLFVTKLFEKTSAQEVFDALCDAEAL